MTSTWCARCIAVLAGFPAFGQWVSLQLSRRLALARSAGGAFSFRAALTLLVEEVDLVWDSTETAKRQDLGPMSDNLTSSSRSTPCGSCVCQQHPLFNSPELAFKALLSALQRQAQMHSSKGSRLAQHVALLHASTNTCPDPHRPNRSDYGPFGFSRASPTGSPSSASAATPCARPSGVSTNSKPAQLTIFSRASSVSYSNVKLLALLTNFSRASSVSYSSQRPSCKAGQLPSGSSTEVDELILSTTTDAY